MKKIIFAGIAAAVFGLPMAATAQTVASTAAAPAAKKYTTTDTEFGTLWDDPAAKAVIVKNLPELGTPEAEESLQMARAMTLRALGQVKPEFFTDAKLAAIDTDLAKLPAK